MSCCKYNNNKDVRERYRTPPSPLFSPRKRTYTLLSLSLSLCKSNARILLPLPSLSVYVSFNMTVKTHHVVLSLNSVMISISTTLPIQLRRKGITSLNWRVILRCNFRDQTTLWEIRGIDTRYGKIGARQRFTAMIRRIRHRVFSSVVSS